jgi:hypothetical protein
MKRDTLRRIVLVRSQRSNQRRSRSGSYLNKRQNLTMRMSMRRFTRLTNAHSKKIENHISCNQSALHALQLRTYHQSLRCSPAMTAGVAKRLWEIEDIVKLLD